MSQIQSEVPLEEIITLAEKLILIPSQTNNTKQLEEVLMLTKNVLSEFENISYNSQGIKSLLFTNEDNSTKKFKIILNAHLDVVPGKLKQYVPYSKNGNLYGRGAYDMKAAAAVMIVLFKELANKLRYPLALQIVTDEEIGGHNGTKYQIEKGIAADFVVAGENTDGTIRNKAKGPLWIKITTHGKSSHAAYPWLGENAIWKMYTLLGILQRIYPIPKTPSWKTTLTVAKIETQNNSFNKVPDECSAWLDVRVIPEEKNKVLEKIKKILSENTEIAIEIQEKPAYTDPHNCFVLQLQDAIKQITKKEGKLTGASGASDVRFYNNLDIPGVEFGPEGSGAHGDEEYVTIESLKAYYQILKQFLLAVK
jgi:succinyl-diaminopimelate desuccinylase